VPRGLIELAGERLDCSIEGREQEAKPRLLFEAVAKRLAAWARRYDAVAARDCDEELAAIGREMFACLDEVGWASAWANGPGDRELEIRVRGRDDAREVALLDAPWELLAWENGPLALDELRLFSVTRRIGAPTPVWVPRHSDLQLMFMAAAPEGHSELDFEREEAAILEATQGDAQVRVVVEETGVLKFLKVRLASNEGPCEVVHLLCHGDIVEERRPVLMLETPEGDVDPAAPGQILQALGAESPPLVVLAACRTAARNQIREMAGGVGRSGAPARLSRSETGGDAERPWDGADRELVASFARQLATKVANVVGWDGAVYDRDATEFAQLFYYELGLGSAVPRAAAIARRDLLQNHYREPRKGRHWHLARVYLGPQGGGPLCTPGKPPHEIPAQLVETAFLDKAKRRVPVASPAEFVGRRRAIQSVLRAFRNRAGVLVHGMGTLGKSSLAARVVSRTPRRPVVIVEQYDPLTIFDRVLKALPPARRPTEKSAWRHIVEAQSAYLADALESWLADPLNVKPILLIVDDLESVLEVPEPDDEHAAVAIADEDHRNALGAVLRAFAGAPTASRLLLTSRYDFRLPNGIGGDLAADLVRVPLAPMPPRERAKQLRAAERLAGREGDRIDAVVSALFARALEAAAGNPGLQAILTKPIVAGELNEAEKTLSQVAVYRETGEPPTEIQMQINPGVAKNSGNDLSDFFKRLSLATYRAALAPDQMRQLAAAALFAQEVPIPRAALEAAGAALGVEDAAAAVERLLALGLLDSLNRIGGNASLSINPLARSLTQALEADQRSLSVTMALRVLESAWSPEMSDVQQAEFSRLRQLQNAPSLFESAELRVDGTLMRSALRKTLANEPLRFANLLFMVGESEKAVSPSDAEAESGT
jgi:hypothetical protein